MVGRLSQFGTESRGSPQGQALGARARNRLLRVTQRSFARVGSRPGGQPGRLKVLAAWHASGMQMTCNHVLGLKCMMCPSRYDYIHELEVRFLAEVLFTTIYHVHAYMCLCSHGTYPVNFVSLSQLDCSRPAVCARSSKRSASAWEL